MREYCIFDEDDEEAATGSEAVFDCAELQMFWECVCQILADTSSRYGNEHQK